jgi:hypothetical protein
MRSLSNYEFDLLQRAMVSTKAQCDPAVLRGALADDVAPEDKDWHHIRLSYSDSPWKGEGYSILADWRASDLDGGIIELLVLGDKSGRPYELEIRRPDLKPIVHLPALRIWR